MSAYDVLDLIPHRPPMVLIDDILEAGDEHVLSRVTVGAGKPFVTASGLPAWAGIELMAQTIAAYAGVMARRRNRPVKLGFLLGTRRYESDCSEFPVGCELRVRVEKVLFDDSGLGVFDCRIDSEAGSVVASLNVFEPPNAAEYLGGTS